MIKTCVMQPYLFPYLGYWQMISAVDHFVIFDDVNYINKGWINRNNILLNGQTHLFTLPLKKASQNKLINEVEISDDVKSKEKILKTIDVAYHKAPFFNEIFPLVERIILNPQSNLAWFLRDQFDVIFQYLDISTNIVMSSEIKKDNNLNGNGKILQICKALDTEVYINAIGGQELYSREEFEANNLILKFIQMRPVNYKQLNNSFVPWLSVIDILMFNDIETVNNLLNEYDII